VLIVNSDLMLGPQWDPAQPGLNFEGVIIAYRERAEIDFIGSSTIRGALIVAATGTEASPVELEFEAIDEEDLPDGMTLTRDVRYCSTAVAAARTLVQSRVGGGGGGSSGMRFWSSQ
jgi:hypothetical protein